VAVGVAAAASESDAGVAVAVCEAASGDEVAAGDAVAGGAAVVEVGEVSSGEGELGRGTSRGVIGCR
jgi:hypothetical protein